MNNAGGGRTKGSLAQWDMTGMKASLIRITVLAALFTAFFCIALLPKEAKASAAYGTNLVVNGNAQVSDAEEPLGWTRSGTNFIVLTLSSGLIPEPFSSDGGNVFDFSPDAPYPASETLSQTIDISNLASDIYEGFVNIQLSAETRKLLASAGNTVKLELLGGSNAVLETYLASGTSVDNIWETLTINQDSIHRETRKLRITLSASIVDASYTDYVEFDGISLTLENTIKIITSASVSGIVAPVTGATPITIADLTMGSSDYTAHIITWYGPHGAAEFEHGSFRASYPYTAGITLKASAGCKFESSGSPLPVNGVYAGNVSGGDVEGNILIFLVEFPVTEALAATSIEIINQPSLLSYIEGQALDISGLYVKLTSNDTSVRWVTAGELSTWGITVDPANGSTLIMANHGQPVSLSSSGITATTNALTVIPATYTISASPTPLAFANAVLGYGTAPADQTVTITNTGNSPVTLTQPTSTHFTLSLFSQTNLNAGASASFTVRPKTGLGVGTYSETITVNTDHSTSASVNVTFTVEEPTYTISISPDSLVFDTYVEGSMHPPSVMQFAITNTGNSAVTIDSWVMPTYFDTTLFPPYYIGAGETHFFNVEPSMVLSAGTYIETLTLYTDQYTSASINLSLTVEPPFYAIELSPTSIDLGSMVEGSSLPPIFEMVTIENIGNAPVTLAAAPVSTAFGFPDWFPMFIDPGFTWFFHIEPVTTLAAGVYHEMLVIQTEQGASTNVDVSFTVEDATHTITANPASLDFGSEIEGYAPAPAIQQVLITNTGNSSVTVTSAPASVNYDIAGPFPITVPEGGSFVFTAQPKFGLGAGTCNETITVHTDHSTSANVDLTFTVQPAIYTVQADASSLTFLSEIEGYASAPAAQTITITNMGNKDVTLTAPTNAYFDITALDPLTLSPAATARFTLQPNTGLMAGSYTETINIEGSNGAEASVEARFTVTPVPTYEISASPESLSFGSLAEGYLQPSASVVTVTNTGNQGIALYQPGAAHHVVGPISKDFLEPYDTATFFIKPKPGLQVGIYNETIRILGSMGINAQVEVTFTCIEPNDDYQVTSGDGGTYQQDGSGPPSLSFTANGSIQNFTGLTINGQLVDEDDYDVYEGSTIVVLHQDFLDTLLPGSYTLLFHFTDGSADAAFVVQDTMPVTGDNNALYIFGALMALCLLALWLMKTKHLKKIKSHP